MLRGPTHKTRNTEGAPMIRRGVSTLAFLLTLVAVSAWAEDKPATSTEKAALTATALPTAATTTDQKAPAEKAEDGKAAAEKSAESGSVRVEVGTYVNQILALDLKGNQFNVDFYVWFRWKGDLKVFDTFELANGRVLSKTGIVKKDLPGGVHYASARLLANITKFWDLRRYPLDDHSLRLEIERNQNEENLLLYV